MINILQRKLSNEFEGEIRTDLRKNTDAFMTQLTLFFGLSPLLGKIDSKTEAFASAACYKSYDLFFARANSQLKRF